MFPQSSSKSIQTDASVRHGPPTKGYVRHDEGTRQVCDTLLQPLSQDGIYFSKHCCCCHRRFSVFVPALVVVFG